MNKTVYSTSTLTGTMRRTGLAGLARVAAAPVYWCGEGCPGKGHDHQCPAGVLGTMECGEESIDGALTCVQPFGHDGDHMSADA